MRNLELRCETFAIRVRDYCRESFHDPINSVYIKQVIRSSSSIGANYIEANENLGKGDLLLHLRISRKGAKETVYWFNLLTVHDVPAHNALRQEAEELKKIFTAIIKKLGG